MKNILVFGGASSAPGTAFIRLLLGRHFPGKIVNAEWAPGINTDFLNGSHYSLKSDDYTYLNFIVSKYNIDTMVNFIEVRNSFPEEMVRINILGTQNLLEISRQLDLRFHSVSTAEVYGGFEFPLRALETSPYAPPSLYAASKAASDHLVLAYADNYRTNATLSNSAPLYGPGVSNDLIFTTIESALNLGVIPVPNPLSVRDWLYLDDHVSAIDQILRAAPPGNKYNIGGEGSYTNIQVVHMVLQELAEQTKSPFPLWASRIQPIDPPPGGIDRNIVSSSKIETTLGWQRSISLEEGIWRTIRAYLYERQKP